MHKENNYIVFIIKLKWQSVIAAIAITMAFLFMPMEVHAHGVNINYTSNVEVEIIATYDSGTPMAGAQVAVYAPDDPTTPWLTGICDGEGRFSFTPDTARPGIWDVQVRLAGHGGMIHIPVGGDTTTADGQGGFSHLQIGIMSACVIWGSIGTALYFSKRRKT
jgi:nickel transport protein